MLNEIIVKYSFPVFGCFNLSSRCYEHHTVPAFTCARMNNQPTGVLAQNLNRINYSVFEIALFVWSANRHRSNIQSEAILILIPSNIFEVFKCDK